MVIANSSMQLLWLLFLSVVLLLGSWTLVPASDDHNEIRNLKTRGEILPLSVIVEKLERQGMRVLEAELEQERGMVVYELELLDADGQIFERYYNAINGQPIDSRQGD